MTKRIVTLYIDDTSLRLVVTDGKRIKDWAESPLEPGLIKSAAVIKEAEVVAKIKQLFEAKKLKDKKIMVGVSGLRCLTRPITLPQLPEAMLDEAVRREAERALPVPLEQLYLSWQVIPAPEGKSQVFLVAIPSKTADDLFRVLHQVGLKPIFMSLKPLLLARTVGEGVAVIVDVQTAEFDIVIMRDGVPQPVRTIAFADETLPWPDKLSVIRSELERTIAFYNSNNPEKPLDPSVPILASGRLANEPELCQSLSGELGHPVSPLSSPLECPEGLDLSRYSVNIGLALEPRKDARVSAVDLNILPVPYQPKPISLTNIMALPGAVIAAGLLVFLVLLVQSTTADIASINNKLNTAQVNLQKKGAEKQKLTKDVAELESQIAAVQKSQDNFTAALANLEKQTARVNGDLEVAAGNLPSAGGLSSISHADNVLTISGQAPSAKKVLTYLLALDASSRFGDIAITQMTSNNMTALEGEGMDFVLLPSLQLPSKWVSSLDAAIGGIPSSIKVTSITATKGILTMDGWTPAENRVLSYLQGLEATGKFLEINITSMTRTEDGGMNFSLVLKLGG